MPVDSKKTVRPIRSRAYLNKDFDSFRAELLRYAKVFFPDKIKDFSEASLGGLLLDMASFVADTNSFYLDHQFGELDPETAVETENLQRHLRREGVPIVGSSSAVVDVDFFIEVPAVKVGTKFVPQDAALPVILEGTVVSSNSGVDFDLVENLDFGKTDKAGDLLADIVIGSTNSDGSPATLILSRKGTCVSGTRETDTFAMSDTFVPFRKIVLSRENVTEIISVRDTEGDDYHEVEDLSDDNVFKALLNPGQDSDLAEDVLEIIPAPRRYVKTSDFNSKLTTLQFGSGDAETLDNDIVPDPSEFAIPLYGKRTFSKFSINPGNLLKTRTLGISPKGTTVTVIYRYGGGLRHNVASQSIRSATRLIMKFTRGPSPALASSVRATVDVINKLDARGGEDAPTLDELRSQIPAAKNAQKRIVSKADLLSRIYTMPSNFGRVFRAGQRSNPNNPLATQLFIISRDKNKRLVTSPDALKKNLVTYLNQFRLLSDAIDILDARVVNVQVEFQISVEPQVNKRILVQKIISRLKTYFKTGNFQIDQTIVISDIENMIFNNPGVVSVSDLKINNLRGVQQGRNYSDSGFDVKGNTVKGHIVGPPGSIFEVRYPDFDIIGSAV